MRGNLYCRNCIVTKGQAAGVSCDTARSSAHDTALARAALGHDTAVGPATRHWAGHAGRRLDRRAGRAWGTRTGAADGWARGAQRARGRAEQAARR